MYTGDKESSSRTSYSKGKLTGLPWASSGWDSALPLLRAQVKFLIKELRSHKLQPENKNETRSVVLQTTLSRE